MNPTNKADYTVHTLGMTQRFRSHLALQNELRKAFPGYDCSAIWHIVPGHGFKGKKMIITNDEDINSLYVYASGKRKKIMLSIQRSCESKEVGTRKRPKRILVTDDDDEAPEEVKEPKKKKQSKSEEKFARVQEVVEKLKGKHGTKYTIEKLNCWAHMIDMGKHDSYEEPPKLPFFGSVSRRPTSQSTGNPSTAQSQSSTQDTVVVDISPGKLVKMRGDSISQININFGMTFWRREPLLVLSIRSCRNAF